MLLRLCWDEVDSLGLSGLLFARLSPALRRKTSNRSGGNAATKKMQKTLASDGLLVFSSSLSALIGFTGASAALLCVPLTGAAAQKGSPPPPASLCRMRPPLAL
ncbi:hypothetical protein EYF80_016192 [Liparis tanakae]|uniref:Uncharacterized protein n=1 Tax=Liparis tanakae TaxID=230148 RepID=A0A4Z2I6C7_9TELE|nr:hypothetical protein EYF80_016192 [Liparis tanakae]